jgi:predicted RNA methylase
MTLEEPQLNGRIASVINRLTNSAGWQAREELWEALRGPRTKPDVLITRADGPPIVLENEYYPATTVADDCMKSMGRELNPSVAGAAGKVSTVIAIRSTDELHRCLTGDAAQRMLEAGHEIEYAVYQGNETVQARFPLSGYIRGNVRDLVDFIRPAAEPQDTINFAIQAFEQGVEDAAMLIMGCARHTNIGEAIAKTLRQQWPADPEETSTKPAELKQERADRNAREQTAKMTATMLINALAYQRNLAGFAGIRDLEQVQDATPGGKLTKASVIEEWDNILDINYWPIFHIARQLLQIIPAAAAVQLLDSMRKTADAIQEAIRQNDVAGTVFQRLIADRQTLATYYTRPESTTLAACLAVPEDLDWANPETLKNYHIADYACGSGGLVLAAYQRARDLHRNHGGDPDSVHAYMMENSLTACDIMPAAVHLTSSLLSSVAPRERYTGTRNVLYPFGGTGDFDNKGKPIVAVGSLELLDINAVRYQAVLPLNRQMVLGATEERRAIEVEMTPLSQSLVIMNPPFTTPTNHAADHAKPGNPAYAAFNTTQEEQKAMSDKVKTLAKDTISDGYAGLGSGFSQIAHNMVKPDGHIALILPLSAMLGGSYDGEFVRSWQKLRQLLAEKYNDIMVLSLAQNADKDASFSADTDLAEVIIVARRLGHGEKPKGLAHFVNLVERPANKLAAQETAKSIRQTVANLTKLGAISEALVGDKPVARIRLEKIDPLEKWTTVRAANLELVQSAKELANRSLVLPQRQEPVSIPMAPMAQIGSVGPVHRLFELAFTKQKGVNSGTTWPILWNRDSDYQYSMAISPDHSGTIKDDKEDEVNRLWEFVSRLHISAECRFNSNPTCAALTPTKSAGGRAWPNFQMKTPEMEKATCVWLNGTLGFISYWIESNRSQSGRGGTTVTAIPNIPCLDFTKLHANQLKAAVKIYDDLCQKRMLPANEAWRDPVRQELDRRLLTEVLGLDDAAVEQLAILRNQWCAEPTVTGTKKTGPPD